MWAVRAKTALSEMGQSGHRDPASGWVASQCFLFEGRSQILFFFLFTPVSERSECAGTVPDRCRIEKVLFVFARCVYLSSSWLHSLACKVGAIKLSLS